MHLIKLFWLLVMSVTLLLIPLTAPATAVIKVEIKSSYTSTPNPAKTPPPAPADEVMNNYPIKAKLREGSAQVLNYMCVLRVRYLFIFHANLWYSLEPDKNDGKSYVMARGQWTTGADNSPDYVLTGNSRNYGYFVHIFPPANTADKETDVKFRSWLLDNPDNVPAFFKTLTYYAHDDGEPGCLKDNSSMWAYWWLLLFGTNS